ncbi:DUF1014-domain-containing protein [Macrolepiota fuliginosa MF-IS2]|uniref:DUF1014-domain-containing protein n=1 Tax=Macrolepiota fuliginosa MF-IS2 TaxID=1400762 RepID=A0A9P6C664_9AGAR|nr:DUF1014-domain-containing protein [Macrolepiota fuliginosa MF-IS2]
MAPGKGTNSKKEAGRAKKAENESKKQATAAAEKERKEAESWTDKDIKGGKAAKEAKEEKRKADLARKAEAAKLLAEEENSAPAKVKSAPKAGQKKKAQPPKPAGPGAIAAGGGLAAVSGGSDKGKEAEPESFSATGIDNALELMEVVTAKMDKASLGQQAAGLEKHPERRFKAAFEAYQERELPNVKQEHPGLRLQQYKELLYKQFQKSPENPFNQATVSYDASKGERLEALSRKRAEVEDRLREK